MKKTAIGIMTALAVVMALGGCQKKYEKIIVDKPGVEQGDNGAAGGDAAGTARDGAAGGTAGTGQGAAGSGTAGAVGGDTAGTQQTGAGKDGTGQGYGRDTAAQGQPGGGDTGLHAETSAKDSVLVAAPAMKDVDETVYVSADSVNLRSEAATTSQVVSVFQKGAKLHRTGYSEEWSRIDYQGKTCYMASRYVTAQAPAEAAGTSAGSAGAGTGTTASSGDITLDPSWKYAEFSKISSGTAKLYKAEGSGRKGITVCVNAGHGTSGGSSVKTQCHPDGTPKVTGGTTSAGATSAVAVSGGMTFADGTAESKVTLAMARKLKDKLLAAGYDVLMIRESDDVQLDNIARTVIANNRADCHIALHWDSTSNNKGAFYMSVPNVSSYRNMEPVKSNWERHHALGDSLIAGLKSAGVKIFSGGSMEMDLTQTSFSTVPSIDIELGDKASDHSDSTLDTLASGLVAGVSRYFGQ